MSIQAHARQIVRLLRHYEQHSGDPIPETAIAEAFQVDLSTTQTAVAWLEVQECVHVLRSPFHVPTVALTNLGRIVADDLVRREEAP